MPHHRRGREMAIPETIQTRNADSADCVPGRPGRLPPLRDVVRPETTPRPATLAPDRTNSEARHISDGLELPRREDIARLPYFFHSWPLRVLRPTHPMRWSVYRALC